MFTQPIRRAVLALILFATGMVLLAGCGPSAGDLAAVDYTPLPGELPVSTPAEVGLDPDLLTELYANAAGHDTIRGLLVLKNDKLVAEQYFNGGSVEEKTLAQSVSKSYISGLVGLAQEQGCLSVDDPLLTYYPDIAQRVRDPRKRQITIREMLQMRGGYPWEETDPDLMAAMWTGDNPPHIAGFPLTADPGTRFQYSNTTAALLADVVSRACDTDLKTFAETYLLEPIGVENGEMWPNTYDDYHPLFHLSARDDARLGLVYLNDGRLDGNQIVPSAWVRDSLQTYSERVSTGGPESGRIGRHFRDIGYGYMWWSGRVGDHTFNYAAGHGGQLIVLLPDQDMVIVTTADPFWQQFDGESWKHEKGIFDLVGGFIDALPDA